MQFIFGAGQLYGVRSDVANSTPIRFGAFQDVQIDLSFDTKEMYGQNSFAIDIARGKGKIEGKAKFGAVNALIYNDLFFGQSVTTGIDQVSDREAASVPSGSGYTITVANAATFEADLGVVYAATGLPLKKVATGPTVGQYSVNNAGVYTFAAADANAAILANYSYATASSGSTIAIANTLMGSVPTWKGVFTNNFKGKILTLTLNACVSSKLSLPTKQDDYSVSEIDFMAQQDAAGNIGKLALSE